MAVILLMVAMVAAVVGGGIAWLVKGQNRLVHSEELVANALSQISVQQASRWDALCAMADICKNYSDKEYKTIMDSISARQGIGPGASAASVDAQEAALQQGMGRVSALAEAYPQLKSDGLYLKAMDEAAQHENQLRMSRMVYNDSVTKYNRLVRGLPGSLLAASLGFTPRDYLQEDPAKAAMPVVI